MSAAVSLKRASYSTAKLDPLEGYVALAIKHGIAVPDPTAAPAPAAKPTAQPAARPASARPGGRKSVAERLAEKHGLAPAAAPPVALEAAESFETTKQQRYSTMPTPVEPGESNPVTGRALSSLTIEEARSLLESLTASLFQEYYDFSKCEMKGSDLVQDDDATILYDLRMAGITIDAHRHRLVKHLRALRESGVMPDLLKPRYAAAAAAPAAAPAAPAPAPAPAPPPPAPAPAPAAAAPAPAPAAAAPAAAAGLRRLGLRRRAPAAASRSPNDSLRSTGRDRRPGDAGRLEAEESFHIPQQQRYSVIPPRSGGAAARSGRRRVPR